MGSLISTEDEREGLNDKRHQVFCLTPAFDSDFVSLLNVDCDFTADNVSRWKLSLDEGKEAGHTLSSLGLLSILNVVSLETCLQELWVGTLSGHLGELVGPSGLVVLEVPVVKEGCSSGTVLNRLLEHDLGKDRHFEEEEIEGAHDTTLDQDGRSLRRLTLETAGWATQDLRFHCGTWGNDKACR